MDVKRKGKAERKFGRFFAFIAFFPQLVAGPIVRRNELLPQLKYPPYLASGMISEGIYRIMKGMGKKLLIADVMRSAIVDPTFADPEMYLGIELWVALYAYTLQIYYDFSAYTDIAIGSALFEYVFLKILIVLIKPLLSLSSEKMAHYIIQLGT